MITKGMTEQEFLSWKENWLKEKGCPFFTCRQIYDRKVCGKDYICGALYTYEKYLKYEWKQECDIKLDFTDDETLPSKCCPSCTNTLNLNEKEGMSCCPYMNDFYEDDLGIKVNRSFEKYFLTLGSYIIPVAGENAYLDLNNNSELFLNLIKKEKK